MAKAVLHVPAALDLISRLRVDTARRRCRGWYGGGARPLESNFWRAFAAFAATEWPQQLPAAVIEATQRERIIGPIARDWTAMPARESVPESIRQEQKAQQEKKHKERQRTARQGQRQRAQGAFARAQATGRGPRITRPRHQ